MSSADPADKGRLFRRKERNSWENDATSRAVQVSARAEEQVVCLNAEGNIYALQDRGWAYYHGRDKSDVWIVERGDTLSSIVRASTGLTGKLLAAKVNEVAAINNISDSHGLSVGEVLRLR